MKQKQNLKELMATLLSLSGLWIILHTLLAYKTPVLFLIGVILSVGCYFFFFHGRQRLGLLLPLLLGWLIFPMKLFYWDRLDFSDRMHNFLLVLVLLYIGVIIQRMALPRRFLFWFNHLSLRKRCWLIFLVAELLFILTSWLLIHKQVILGGDEPHYLVIAQSIAHDGDINVFNQYARELYREFIDVPLDPHARIGKGFKVWYSYGHLPGLSLTLAPFFLVKLTPLLLYFLIRSYLGLFAGLLGVLIYLFALKLWSNRSLAFFISVTYLFTAPVFFYGVHIFAELQASLLILSSLYLILYAKPWKKEYLKYLLAGLLLGITVFWGLKYAIFIGLLGFGFFLYWVRQKKYKQALLFIILPIVMQVLFFAFLYYAYGNFQPMSIYNGVMTAEEQKAYDENMEQIPLQMRVETLLGIFFDQRDGLITYNPFYLLFFPGLWLAFRKYRQYWPHILIASTGFAFIFFIGYSTVRAGYCPQARYLVPSAWALMLFAVIYYRETKNKLFAQLFLYLPVLGLLTVLYQVWFPFTLYQSVTHLDLNRPGLLYQQWGNLYLHLSDCLPSFTKIPGNFKYVPNVIFFLFLMGFILLAIRKMKSRPGLVGRVMHFFIIGFCLVFFVLFPIVPDYNPIYLSKGLNPPCEIYGVSPYPTEQTDRKFELIGKNERSFTISTEKPAKSFVMVFENYGTHVYRVKIVNFDKSVQTVTVPVGAVMPVELHHLFHKEFRGRIFYRFHLIVEPEPTAKPELFVEIYPGL